MSEQFLHFDILDSTNTYLKNNINSLNNLTFVDASFQTNGRGRNKRKWESIKNENLMFSFLIKDERLIESYKYLSLGIGAIIATYLIKNDYKNVTIKWPNDIFINDKKVGGILLEGRLPSYLIIGVGLNVNQINFGGSFLYEPTSLKLESNKSYSIEILKFDIYQMIIDYLKHFDNKQIINFINENNYLKNKNVEINGVKGIVKCINDDGEIVIINNKQEFYVCSDEIKIVN